jgi:hypothetical protein
VKPYRALVAAFGLAFCSVAPVLAFSVHGARWQATYVAAYRPAIGTRSNNVPFSGTMKLTVDHGIVKGTYIGESVRPDPLYGRIVSITGGVEHGRIMLNFSAFGGFTVHGTLAQDGEISGTAVIRGSLYNFLAKVKSSP